MITYNSIKFNQICDEIEEILINNNIDLKDAEQSIDKNIINNLTAHINNHLEPASKFTCTHCPKCGYIHLSPMQSSYSRNIIFKIENLLIKVKISVQRLICNNCGSTHSILPSFCVPFKQYSKQAILEIVSQADKTSSQVVADKLNIESKQVRRFIKLFYSFKNDILLLYQMYPNEFNQKFDKAFNASVVISSLSTSFENIFFKEFKKIYLYIKVQRQIYITYEKLSI